MAGDTVTIATQAWYTGAVEPPPSGASNLLNDLLSALTGGVISNSHSLYSTTDNNPTTVLSGDLPAFFTNDENNHYATSAPKAFLNYVAFDNQLNMNAANSGVVQVPTITGSEQAQPLVAPEQIIQKDGYLYIYVSNESAQRVFFDNLVIHHNKGHLMEEDQYYPFGLKMAGISDEALPVVPNNYLYNGKELNHEGFSDGTGLDWYDYGFRNYDPQIGRFTEQDPLMDEFATVSPYQYALNDPISNIDADGLAALPMVTVFGTASQDIAASAWLTGITVTASRAGGLLQGLGVASKIGAIGSIGINTLNILGSLVYAFGITKDIGDGAANVAEPASNFLDKNGNLIKHINDGSNAVYQQIGSGYFTHYKFTGFDESQGGIDKVNMTTAIQEQQDLNEENLHLVPVNNETFCNYATQDILNTVASSVVDGNELRIVGVANTMTTLFGKSPLLKQVSLQVAKENAKNGGLSLFGYINIGGHGHVGTFSVGENIAKGQIANIGLNNGFLPLQRPPGIHQHGVFGIKLFPQVKYFILRNNIQLESIPQYIPFFNF